MLLERLCEQTLVDEVDFVLYSRQILEAIKYLEELNVLHQNILVSYFIDVVREVEISVIFEISLIICIVPCKIFFVPRDKAKNCNYRLSTTSLQYNSNRQTSEVHF